MNKTYTTQVFLGEQELTIDIDDLIGINSQLTAIIQGWGMEFSVCEVEEREIKVADWKTDGKIPSLVNFPGTK